MLSAGEIIDKLVIELIKADTVRQEMNMHTKDSTEYVCQYEKLLTLNKNRNVLKGLLDDKIEDIKNGKANRILQHCRTY